MRSLERPGMDMYLWFYEWNLFGGLAPGPGDDPRGDHSKGRYDLERTVAPDGRSARIRSEHLSLSMTVDAEGVALELTVTNPGAERCGPLAALLPCYNPGPEGARNQELAHHHATYYVGRTGLERAPEREIHFNAELKQALRERSPQLEFDFSGKWPTSDHDALGGLVLRESRDGSFVTGIAWEDFVSIQAHNPWQCMHLSVGIGGLAPGATRTVQGRIWHFPGDRQEIHERWRAAFGAR